MMFSVERHDRGEWFDLFCCESCLNAVYDDPSDAEWFPSWQYFVDAHDADRVTEKHCLNCCAKIQ